MILLLIIVAVLIAIGFIVKDSVESGDYFNITFSLFLIMFGSVVAMMPLFISKSKFPIEISRREVKIPIYSLRNDNQIQGSFFLGSGQIDQTEHYYTFIDNGRGGFNRFKIQAYNVTIYQDEDLNPYLRYQMVKFRHSKWVCFFNYTWEEETRYDFHVPENTIIQEYKVN